jgi:hypothetical protein
VPAAPRDRSKKEKGKSKKSGLQNNLLPFLFPFAFFLLPFLYATVSLGPPAVGALTLANNQIAQAGI